MNSKKGLRGPTTKKDIKNDILLFKKNDVDGKLSAKDIREKLLKIHPGSKYIPKERTIYNIIQKNKNKVIFNPIDSPWSIGCCEKYNIPADIIPTLIKYEQSGQPKFTIRQAKWFSRLKPIVFEMSAKKYPLADCLAGLPTTGPVRIPAPDNDSRFYLLALIAFQYAGAEELSEMEGKPYPDTSGLDSYIFTEGKIGNDEQFGEPIHVNAEDRRQTRFDMDVAGARFHGGAQDFIQLDAGGLCARRAGRGGIWGWRFSRSARAWHLRCHLRPP